MNNMDKREIIRLIHEWNNTRYELFAISEPNDRCEFHGVMRFYFQDAGEKVSTKCIRVDSTATTEDVIQVLIEKFRPDMKSLSSAKDYAIYEVHVDAQERKLDTNERPLWIQLEWGKEGREGRFLLKNENCKTVQFDTHADGLIRDKKRMSKRDKKKLQKQKEAQKENSKVNVAEHLYKEVPDSNFTRSISNPEIVMARRRQQKLENKLKQIKSRDGGGTLKVYGETLKPDVPYKTLLLSSQDSAAFTVKETLEKYGLTNEDPENYCLVQVITPSREEREKHGAQIKEYILEDTACPLDILMKHPNTGGAVIFQIRRCTPDILAIRKQKKKLELEKQQQQLKFQSIQSQPNLQPPQQQQQQQQQQLPSQVVQNQLKTQKSVNFQPEHLESNNTPTPTTMELTNQTKLPFMVELSYEGFELPQPRIIQIKSDFYEIGNDKFLASTHPLNYIRIDATIPGIEKKHCAIKKSNDNLQLLLIPYAETYVNDRLVKEHTQLFNNFTIRLGKYCLFRLENPNDMSGLVNKQPQPALPANYGLLYDNGQPAPVKPQITNESGLPGLLEFPDDGEDSLLATICTTNQTNWQFKLAPVYTMYMMLRYRLSQKYKPDLTFGDKMQSISYLIHKMVNFIREAVDVNHLDKFILPFWLANSSELLYFLKQDMHLSQISFDAQDDLAECVQISFKYLVNIMQQQLDLVLASFFDPSDHIEDVNLEDAHFDPTEHLTNSRPTLKQVVQVLNEAMNLLRGSRVNAALTIQLFSQLFHYISMWLFNRLVKDQRSGLCSRYWGDKLARRLSKIQVWAEKQGLELAADCHLQRICQAAFFLQTPKHDVQELSSISSNCFALNSLQLKCLIKNYLLAPNEPVLSAQLCNNLIAIAQNTADEVLKQEGKHIQLEEDVDLQLPFLLPEDGHSSEFIKGLPTGLLDFLESLQNAGHCWLWQNTQGPGNWKKYMSKEPQVMNEAQQQQQQQQPQQQPSTPVKSDAPQIIQIKLAKKNNGLGLSIVAARGNNQVTGIYIKSVVPGGAAHDDGRLNGGDQLLAVDENSLINVTQERAAELMTKSGPVVTLTVAKDAASYYELDALLNKSPGPQQQQQQQIQQQFNQAQSMPALNNQPIQSSSIQQNQVQHQFSAQTLPRNHHLHQQYPPYFNQQPQQQQQQQQTPQTRSMSQEILSRNGQSIPNLTANNQPRQQIQTQQNNQFISPTHQYQRTLPNEQQIRYGSERPASNFSQQNQQLDNQQRFYNQRNLPNELGPRFGSERPASTLPHHQPQPRFNPAADSSPIKQQQQLQQPIQTLKQRQASLNELDEINYNNQQQNKFDELYGKVNPTKQNIDQFKTLPTRPNIQNLEDSRTKSFGQLYEQIWSANQSTRSNVQMSVDDLTSRVNKLQFEQANVRVIPIQQQQQQQHQQRNYENQIVNQAQVTRPPPPVVLAKPAIPAKNFNLNIQNNNQIETPCTAKIVNQRERTDEEFRMNLLKQRMEMLGELETKAYRTNEEENRLNKLRTEIEFDKRVIEMNTQMSLNCYLDETAEENDMLDYAPEVRERFANEISQRKKQFQEVDRVLEAKREEHRLKRHLEMNNRNSEEFQQEIEVLQVPTRSSADLTEFSRPQKHVQFMQESEMISPKSRHENGMKITSSSSSSDQLDSSPSTPPPLPAQPQPNHHPKRVMFSDIEFESKDSKNDDIIHNTPSVIGANEVYVDQRLKAKLQQQQMQQNMLKDVEGEKLSFKDKMKLFAKQSGENALADTEAKLKVSKKQREIESKFVIDSK